MFKRLNEYIKTPRYRSAGLTFFLLSVVFSFWVTRLPDVRDRLELSEGEIGLALFFIPMGALAAMSVSHGVNRKFGEGRMMSVSLALMALTAILPVSASTYGILCGSLFLLGFFMGLTDISMNAVVSIFEKQDDKQIMATSHGFFSLGGIVGAPLGSLIAGYQLSPVLQMSVTALVIILLVVFVIMPPSIGYSDQHSDQAIFAIPRGPLVPLAIMAFCAMMSEGSVADWSAIYLKDVVKAPDQLLGFGYAAFSLTMTFGRFYGDSLIALIGPKRVLLAGFSIAVIGFLITLYPEFYTSLFGFALIGAGFASIIPVLFSTAGNMEGISSSYGITAVATAGYAGFLIGPVMIGYVAEYQSLTISFVLLIIVVGIALILVPASFRNR